MIAASVVATMFGDRRGHPAGLDKRGDDGPVFGTGVMASKQGAKQLWKRLIGCLQVRLKSGRDYQQHHIAPVN